MAIDPPYSQRTPTEWSGARSLMQQWVARRKVVESLLNLVGSGFFLFFGLIALVFTACALAALVLFLLVEGNALLALSGLGITLLRPALFAALFLIFLALTILHAYRTR